MEPVKVKINSKQQNGYYGTLGMKYLLDTIKSSDLFEIEFHREIIKTARHFRATILYCNDKKVYLDFWEYPAPSYTMNIYNSDFDLIIKLQDRYMENKQAHRYLTRKNIIPKSKEEIQEFRNKIVPWTFFPSRLLESYIGREEEIYKKRPEVDQLGFFCGKMWKCRNNIVKSMKSKDIFCQRSDQGNKATGRPLTDKEFFNHMKRSKYGIVLAGRATAVTDAKNRREIDYMMMKKPLLLNYKPKYYDELVEGEHYIFIDENTDFNKIEDNYDIDKIAKNGYNWYLRNVTPEGAANTFRRILKEQLDI